MKMKPSRPQSPKTYFIHVYILHQAILLTSDLFFARCVCVISSKFIH